VLSREEPNEFFDSQASFADQAAERPLLEPAMVRHREIVSHSCFGQDDMGALFSDHPPCTYKGL
jgi:hypothetical protein